MPRNVLALSLVSLLNDASSETVYPLLPFFLSATLGASPFIIGLIEGATESASSLLKLASGYFSDKFAKHKLAVFIGYGLSTVMRPFLGFASNWSHVLGLRLVDRLGKGIRSAPRDALIADSIAPEKRGLAFGFHRAMDNAGAVLGPLLAYVLISYFASDRQNPTSDEYTQVFIAASFPALVALFLISFFVRDKNNKLKVRGSRFKVQNQDVEIKPKIEIPDTKIVFDVNFKKFLGVLVLFTLANSADVFLLLRAHDVGITQATIPLLWAYFNAVKVISSLIGGDLSDRIGRKPLIFAGWILYSLVYAGFAFVTTVSEIWVLFGIYGVYFGLTEGVEKALVADLTPKEHRGTAFGWYHLAFGIAVFPASIITGALWKFYGAETALLTGSVISLIAALLLLTVKTRQN
ncbi:MAG: MFS transporter [Pyrinomonadaceae bacterium]|nr:MFS transporter [Pyrinomonadaceae bacterium]